MRNIYSLFLFVTCGIGWLVRASHGFRAVTTRKRVGGNKDFKYEHFLARTRNHQKPTSSVQLWAKMDDDDDDNDDDGNAKEWQDTPTPSFVAVGVAAVAFVAFWPLLALLRVNGPTAGFDIDIFMALKGILDTSSSGMGAEEIYELPPLSPAEQLVGSFFGPPTR
jgi:hypothetical protein